MTMTECYQLMHRLSLDVKNPELTTIQYDHAVAKVNAVINLHQIEPDELCVALVMLERAQS